MLKLLARSPLHVEFPHALAAFGSDGVMVTEQRDLSALSVRCWRGQADGADLVAARVGVAPHPLPNRVAEADGARLAWREPNCWILLCDRARADAVIQSADAGAGVHVTDLSSAWWIAKVEGERARLLLSAGCPLDMSRFEPGQCAASIYNEISVHIQCLNTDAFLIACDRALAAAFWADITEAAHYLPGEGA